MSERGERHGGLRHATAAGLPRGAPERLRQAERLAAVRAALGEALGAHLTGLSEEPGRVVLRLAGGGWERGLALQLDELAGVVARALRTPLRPITIESAPSVSAGAARGRPQGGAEDPGNSPLDPAERRRRLEAAASRLLARPPEPPPGRGTRSSVDRGPGGQ
ncbi:MAG: hypothetical protein MUE47_02805 [Acidobacteria bacterium]|jgi:hypothetical protein|nr:hypothetical protein [Acidobacteriota bacterium]